MTVSDLYISRRSYGCVNTQMLICQIRINSGAGFFFNKYFEKKDAAISFYKLIHFLCIKLTIR